MVEEKDRPESLYRAVFHGKGAQEAMHPWALFWLLNLPERGRPKGGSMDRHPQDRTTCSAWPTGGWLVLPEGEMSEEDGRRWGIFRGWLGHGH